MNRFYIDRVEGETVTLTDLAQLHHLKDVLRQKIGGSVAVFDGEGNEYSGMIESIEKKQAVLTVKLLKKKSRQKTNLTIACAIPKGDRMDDVIDRLTQLGVTRIIPMLTERVVVKLDDAKKKTRLKRWQAIARSAAEQSQRNNIPGVASITPFSDVIADVKNYDLKLIPNLYGSRTPINDVLSGSFKEIIVLIGPEGDFSPEEVKIALDAGFIAISLGENVLRVATAAAAVAGYISFALNT